MNGQTLNCQELQRLVQEFSLVRSCDVTKSGALRISTPFSYPNGSLIDLFLAPTNDLFGGYYLTDYGQTADYLADMHIKPWATKKRRTFIDDICNALGVTSRAGAFEIRLDHEKLADLPHIIVRLAQACIRVADLAFTQKLQTAGTFQENVEEFIAATELPYDSDVELIGSFGKVVKVDFRVKGEAVTSLVQTLSTPYPGTAHLAANEIFRRWYDLNPHRSSNQFLTLYDAESRIFREDDLRRLSDFSLVLGFPGQQDEIQEVLAA